MREIAPRLICGVIAALNCAAGHAATYTIEGLYSHAQVTTNWYNDAGMYSRPVGAPDPDAPVIGIVDATFALNPSPPGKLLSFGPGSAIAIGSHSSQLDLMGVGGVTARLQATLSGMTLKPNGSVLLDYNDGSLPGGLPVDIGLSMGTPTLTYQITSPQGDLLASGSANLWRYTPSVLVGSQLASSSVPANDDSFAQSMWLAMSIPRIGFSDSSGTHDGTLEFVIRPQWVAVLTTPVPEPAAWALSLSGLLVVAAAAAVHSRRSDRR